jgi:hypothetical protein
MDDGNLIEELGNAALAAVAGGSGVRIDPNG